MLCLVVAFFGAVAIVVVVDVVAAAAPFIGIVHAYVDASAVDARSLRWVGRKKTREDDGV